MYQNLRSFVYLCSGSHETTRACCLKPCFSKKWATRFLCSRGIVGSTCNGSIHNHVKLRLDKSTRVLHYTPFSKLEGLDSIIENRNTVKPYKQGNWEGRGGGGIEGLSPGTKQTVRNNEVSVKRGSTVGVHHVLGLEYFELWVMLELLAIAGFACRAVFWAFSRMLRVSGWSSSIKAEPNAVCHKKGVVDM